MRKINAPPPNCPLCKKPMKFVLVATGGRRFRCEDCYPPAQKPAIQDPPNAGAIKGEMLQ